MNIVHCVFKMSNGFSGGVAGTHAQLCGAFSGGTMLIGALFGRVSVSEDDFIPQSKVRQFREEFIDRFGTLNCQELIDKREAQRITSCRSYVEDIVDILLPYLE